MTSVGYPYGVDYEWFAVDARGRIARFTTGGLGPIPTAALFEERHCETLQGAVSALPRRSGTNAFTIYPLMDDFNEVSAAGIYTYDCDDISSGSNARNYKLVTAPTSPIVIEDLPVSLNEACVRLRSVTFGDVAVIGAEQFDEYVTPD